jgi:hypothetical protein
LAAANTPMVLTGGGYVALGEAGARAGRVAKDNPYHDARGWFTTADGAGGAASRRAKPREHVAQGGVPEEENRDAREPGDPLAEARSEEWAKAIETLRALDPKNPNLIYATAPDWVPTDQNIADINAEIKRLMAQRAIDHDPSAPPSTPTNPRGFEGQKSSQTWQNQMIKRGWTSELIEDAIKNGQSYPAPNKVNPGNGATRYVSPRTGQSVIIDNVTGGVIHVGGPSFDY